MNKAKALRRRQMNNASEIFPRGTGLLIIVAENSNPNGDPDQESDPRRRSHDKRGMITGVSFKRKLRDLVLRKDGPVWAKLAAELKVGQNDGIWALDDYLFEILESREESAGKNRKKPEALLKNNLDGFKKRYWDARVFGNTFLEKEIGDTIRSGIAQFGLAVSVAPVRVHRLTQTKLAPAQSGKGDSEGPTRGMAPLAHRVIEHGVYCMPFFVNPTAAQGQRGTGCQAFDIDLLFRLIRFAYPHTKSDIRPLVEVQHAWYAEHADNLCSFSEFKFIEALTPKRIEGYDKPSVSGVPLGKQYDVPKEMPKDFSGKLKNEKLYDLCSELPPWCSRDGR